MIRVALILIALNFISSQTINRYGNTTANFLEIGVGSGPTAMGDAQVALADDVSSIYWNPAGLASLKKPSVVKGYYSNCLLNTTDYKFKLFAILFNVMKAFRLNYSNKWN